MDPYAINFPTVKKQDDSELDRRILSPDEIVKEISWSETDLYHAFFSYGQNPDPIVRNKGIKLYRDMMEDDQVKVCVDLRKQARLSTPWTIIAGKKGDPTADMYAAFITHVFRRMSGTIESNLYQIYSAIEYGFSMTEIVYKILEDGPFAGKIGLRALKTREPYNYDFKIDPHGNLLGLTYIGLAPFDAARTSPSAVGIPSATLGTTIETPSGLISASPRPGTDFLGSFSNPFPPEKFIIYSYAGKFGNWYGESELRAAFRSWLIKKHVMKFWSIWLERYASPFVWAQYKRDAMLKKETLDTLDNMLRNLSSRQGIRVSDAITLNPIQFTSEGGKAYEDAIESHNRFIAHAILTPNLLGFTGAQASGKSSGGSYALGLKHFEAFMWVLKKMGRDTEEDLLGEQLIKRLINLNFQNVDPDLMPSFKFQEISDDMLEARAKIIALLVQNNLVNPQEDWVREYFSLPKDEKLQPDGLLPGQPPRAPIDPNQKKQSPFDNPNGQGNQDSINNKEKKIIKKKYQSSTGSPFLNKVQVKAFGKDLDIAEQRFFEDVTKVVTDLRDTLFIQIERNKILSEFDPKLLKSLKLNPSELKDVVNQWLVKIHLDSKLKALEELKDSGANITITRNFVDTQAPFEPWQPLPPRQAVEYFNKKVKARIVTEDGEKKLIELGSNAELPYYDQKAFAIAGVVRDDILNDSKQILLTGIKKQDAAGTMSNLKDMFNKYIQQGVAVDDELLAPHRISTIVRTNLMDAVNQGRMKMYLDEGIPGMTQFFQWTSVLDDRTTDYCECMDSRIFRIELIGELVPPAHPNCRSITVPISQFELDEMAANGEGVEISDPCPGRSDYFMDIKREPVTVDVPEIPKPAPSVAVIPKPPSEGSVDIPPAPKSPADISANQKLKDEITQLIRSCPYSTCHSSQDLKVTKTFMNIAEFMCGACKMPFRISNKGDLYLFDAGLEKWERVSMGLMPLPFREK